MWCLEFGGVLFGSVWGGENYCEIKTTGKKTTGGGVSFGAGRFICTIVLAATIRRNTHRQSRALFHFRAVLPPWLRGSVAGLPLRRRVLESIRYPVTGARRNPPPLCGPRPAGRPVSFPHPLSPFPNSSTAHSGR